MSFINTYFKTIFYFVALSLFIVSCGSAKPVSTSSKSTTFTKNKTVERAEGLRNLDSGFSGKITNDIQKLLKDAQRYLGTPYKYGGSTSKGFDCSGFTFTVFEQNSFVLPRRSSDQA
ncbi:MAG: NlpC/P60 family protein, partial [Cruoricaptor ignavus]|nr:NlpC/P60 family protein [Cruoricaptor ignavus]